ncbi:MAG: asparagine synthase (glutamine-hydrolyzing) [Candidatus Komeilibacteria bacterium]|nr:asparagine synthase (glutamine-hydrolyzing) [Candidatus Komeilibacteria bacterium]
MCGINGFNFNNREIIDQMNLATKHRGPDGVGVFIDANVSFGHNLLAIVETPANAFQPLVSNDKNFALIYNGEIYNYHDLKNQLIAQGLSFATNSDTEVLFKGLQTEGLDFVNKLNGMFAFAFYDKRAEKIYLARDYGGMKPLYYYCHNQEFIFSSELRGIFCHKSVERKIDLNSLGVYFSLGYVPGQKTLIENIFKVCPGQFLVFDLAAKKITKSWYGYQRPQAIINTFNPVDFRNLIGAAVKKHTMDLRPFGLYLSGGLDSTMILHELSKISKEKIKTYTTAFITKNKELNEDAMLARQLCQDYQIEHHELLVGQNDFINSIEKTIATVEEPRYNFSLPAYWLLAQEAAKDITVVLNGNGGDELFLGYPRYLETLAINDRYAKYPDWLLDFWYSSKSWRKGELKTGQFWHLADLVSRWVYQNNINRLNQTQTAKIFKFNPKSDLLNLIAYLKSVDYPFIKNSLPDNLNQMGEMDRLLWLSDEDFLRTDKITMHFGLEGRFPFLAKEIVDYSNVLTSKEKLKNGQVKNISRLAYKNLLPDYIINKKKTGWYAPAVEWMHSDLGEMVKNVLSNGYYPATSGLFDLNYLRENFVEKEEHFSQSNIKKFLPVFAFQIWAKTMGLSL